MKKRLFHAALPAELPEEFVHEFRAFRCRVPSGSRQHPFRNVAELDKIFAVGGIFASIRFTRDGFRGGIVKSGADPAGEMESASDTDRSDGIELVRIIENFVDERFRLIFSAIAVTFNGVCDELNQRFVVASAFAQKADRFSVSGLRMTDFPV